MIRFAPAAAALLLLATPALAEDAAPAPSAPAAPALAAPLPATGAPLPLVPNAEPAAPATTPSPAASDPAAALPAPAPPAAETPSPAAPSAAQPAAAPAPAEPPAAAPVQPQSAQPQPAQAMPAEAAAQPMSPPPAPVAVPAPQPGLPWWAAAFLMVAGAAVAGAIGLLVAAGLRRGERTERRRAVAAGLALELGARLQAFDSVPVPPNAEAGVSFVSLVQAVAGLDFAFRAAQDALHLLPGKLALQVTQHYSAVQRVATFVKGQSLAAAVRMLQANRIGGQPCPDAGAMRDAHVELAGAFHGIEKLIEALARLE